MVERLGLGFGASSYSHKYSADQERLQEPPVYITKRQFLQGITSAVAGIPILAEASQVSPSKLHERAADIVNGLPDKPAGLKLLAPDGCQPNLQPIIQLFEALTEVRVELIVTPVDDINAKLLLTRYSSDEQGIDIALPATFGLPDLVSANAIKNLDRYASRYEPKDFQKDALYTLGDYYRGQLYGYQTDGDAYLMFYHQDMLKDAGNIARYQDQFGRSLTTPETWEELDRQIRFFHRPDKKQYGGALFRTPGYLVWEWWIRFHAKGFFPLADSLEPQINNEAGVKALEELIGVSQYLSPGAFSNGLFENWREYGQGNIYCNIGWGGTQKYLNTSSDMKGRLSYSSTPGGVVKGELVDVPYFNWGWNYAVPESANHPEVAYLFSLFATSPVVSSLAVRENGYFDPFRELHYQDGKIQDMYGKEFLTAHARSMKNSIPDFYISGRGQYMGALQDNLQRALLGKMKPKDALDLTSRTWKRLHRRFNAETINKEWMYIKSQYPAKILKLFS